jgi:mono/diheme cytochrome c family protein
VKFAIACAVLALGLSAAEPNLPKFAPAEWAGKPNPFAGDSRARKAGAKLFARECAECHGESGQGMGKAPSLQQNVVSQAPPGAIYWIVGNGAIFHGMPSFAHLPEPQRWQIVTFIQSLNSRTDQN